MEKYIEQKGFVALLDVLGASKYCIRQAKQFLSNRDNILRQSKDVRLDYQVGGESYTDLCFTERKMLTFADNIVFALPVDGSIDMRHFLWVAQWLRKILCDFLYLGVLLRGAVSVGKYVTDGKYTMIGPATSDAAKYFELADWMGVVLTPKSQKDLEQLIKNSRSGNPKSIAEWLVNYSVPSKESYEELWTVAWPFKFLRDSESESKDPLDKLCDRFKNAIVSDIPPSKQLNIENYLKWYRDNVYPDLDIAVDGCKNYTDLPKDIIL